VNDEEQRSTSSSTARASTGRRSSSPRADVTLPTARAAGLADLEIVVDSRERYAYRFAGQQVSTAKETLPCGDYGLRVDGRLVASVERKSLSDLVSSVTSGRLRFAMAELAALPRAAVVVEDRYSALFKQSFARPAMVADGRRWSRRTADPLSQRADRVL